MDIKLKFKVGDRVRVKSLEWYNRNKNVCGEVQFGDVGLNFAEQMKKYCGKVLNITELHDHYYHVEGNTYYWEDWMLEDDVVETTEEKTDDCEVLKFIKSMKTKEMTKEEIFAYLKNTKIMCTSDEETKKVQEKLFELGIEWKMTGVKINEKMYLLHINYNYLLFNSDIRNWMNSKDKRIEPSEILAIKIKEEKPKFNPSTLQAFDKVLVRDDENEEWSCNLYSHLITGENKYKYKCIYDPYVMCIPYNDDTKHLLGTKNEAPDFYRV